MSDAEVLQIATALIGAFATLATGLEAKLVRTLKATGAVSPETAITLPRLKPISRWRLQRLRHGHAVVAVDPDRFYLDEMGHRQYRRQRRVRVLTVLAILAAGGALAYFAGLL